MKKRDGGWEQRSDKKDSREIRKKKRKICKKEITTKKKFGSLNERKSFVFMKKLKIYPHNGPSAIKALFFPHTIKHTSPRYSVTKRPRL